MIERGYKLLYNETSNGAHSPKRSSFHSTYKFWTVLLVFLGSALYLLNIIEFKSVNNYVWKTIYNPSKTAEIFDQKTSVQGYLVNTPGCRIPEMDLFDESIKSYIFAPQPINCTSSTVLEPLFESNLTSLYMNTSVLQRYGVADLKELFCCYTEFVRVEPDDSKQDGKVVYSDSCIELLGNSTNIENEFIRVTCRKQSSNEKIYEDYFAFVPIENNGLIVNSTISRPNVLIVGVDSVSRANMHRQLPQTYSYLSNQLDAVELLGYNKVGDNTFVNLIPVLTGLYEKELTDLCWPTSNTHFDQCPFVWKRFKDAGYVTAIGEDCSHIGTFNYLKTGFKKQPVDYYYTSFDWEAQDRIGSNKDFNCNQCFGERQVFKVTVNYIDKFVRQMSTQPNPYFALFWTNSYSHDYLNRPALGDKILYNLFSKLNEDGHLSNTVVVFMSDHGMRWGNIRNTYQGQLEERLPFVVMVLPKQFRQQYSEALQNLKTNVRRLTTPFDLHETFNDFLDVNKLEKMRNVPDKPISRGYSLFSYIPPNRTCQEAEIESHWCTCQESHPISPNDNTVKAAGQFAVKFINIQLKGYAQCALLALDTIQRARVMTYQSEHITEEKSFKDYIITFTTMPGNATFEVTVRSKNTTSLLRSNGDFGITGTISRINSYGKQSSCITDFHLKLYCYCRRLLHII